MGKKGGAKLKKLNKVKQTSKKPFKKQVQPQKGAKFKSPKSFKSSQNSSQASIKKPKVRFDSVTPNQSQKSVSSYNASRVSARKPTPFPKKVESIKKRPKVEEIEEEESGSEEFDMSDVSFDSEEEMDEEVSDMSEEEGEDSEEDEEEEPVVKTSNGKQGDPLVASKAGDKGKAKVVENVSKKQQTPTTAQKLNVQKIPAKKGDAQAKTPEIAAKKGVAQQKTPEIPAKKGVAQQKTPEIAVKKGIVPQKTPEIATKKGVVPQKTPEITTKNVKKTPVPDKGVKRKREESTTSMSAEEYTIFNDNRRLFVTNLPDNVTEEEVKGLHKEIEDFVFLSAFRKRKGSVILVFADESVAETAKGAMGRIRGKELTTDYVGGKNSKKKGEHLGPVVDNRLYVGNMGEQCSEDNLRRIFPDATEISVPSNKRHSFGFVQFADASSAMEAIREKNYSAFNGEKIIVQFARARLEEPVSLAKKVKMEESEEEEEDESEDIGEEDMGSFDEEEEDMDDDMESFDDEED